MDNSLDESVAYPSRIFAAQLRHARYYLGYLRNLNDQLLNEGESRDIFFEIANGREQIKYAYTWCSQNSYIHEEVRQLQKEFEDNCQPLWRWIDLPQDIFLLEAEVEQTASLEEKLRLLKELGNRYIDFSDYKNAQEPFQKRLALCDKTQALIGETKRDTLHHLALIHHQLKDYRTATKYQRVLISLSEFESPKHIFISYTREDIHAMNHIRSKLEAEGFSVWVDQKISSASNRWRQTVAEAIKTAGCVVVILSPNCESSEWVNKELAYASIQGISIFPVIIAGDKKASVPIEIIDLQWTADLRKNLYSVSEMDKLVSAIRQLS